MNTETCNHNFTPETRDQTLGIFCSICGVSFHCWMDRHIPEIYWNITCLTNDVYIPCKENRVNFFALCGGECTPTGYAIERS